jgi:hypothetical protein
LSAQVTERNDRAEQYGSPAHKSPRTRSWSTCDSIAKRTMTLTNS